MLRLDWQGWVMSRTAEIIGAAVDWTGRGWLVRERRPTGHGFDVLIGWPDDEPRGAGTRGVAVILTADLAHYLTTTRQRDIQLPIGLTAAKRLRRELGVVWSWDAWWDARRADLLSMTLEAFAVKHGCSVGAASQRRAACLSSPSE